MKNRSSLFLKCFRFTLTLMCFVLSAWLLIKMRLGASHCLFCFTLSSSQPLSLHLSLSPKLSTEGNHCSLLHVKTNLYRLRGRVKTFTLPFVFYTSLLWSLPRLGDHWSNWPLVFWVTELPKITNPNAGGYIFESTTLLTDQLWR